MRLLLGGVLAVEAAERGHDRLSRHAEDSEQWTHETVRGSEWSSAGGHAADAPPDGDD